MHYLHASILINYPKELKVDPISKRRSFELSTHFDSFGSAFVSPSSSSIKSPTPRAPSAYPGLPSICTAFQPIMDGQSGLPFAYEALVRGAMGELAGEVFKGIAPGYEAQFDGLCREAAINSVCGLDIGNAALSVNVAACAIGDAANWLPDMIAHWSKTGLPPSRLILELTEEEAEIPIGEAAAFAALCRRGGVRLAIDDFGSGRSGLLRLIECRPDLIKIDRSLLHGAPEDPIRIAVLRATVQLCRDVGATPIAEGVETIEEYRLLRKLGVRYFQGWLIGRPSLGTLSTPIWPDEHLKTTHHYMNIENRRVGQRLN